MPVPKPSQTADWATSASGGDMTPPSGGKIAAGWTSTESPPHNFFNWWQNLVGKWTDYLNDLANQTWVWAAGHTFNALVNMGAGLRITSGGLDLNAGGASITGGTDTDTLIVNSTATFNAGAACGSQKLTSVADPTGNQDAATKNYVDNHRPYAISSSSGGSTVSIDSTAAQITNQTVTLTTHGRPVLVGIMSDGSGGAAELGVNISKTVWLIVKRDDSEIGRWQWNFNVPGASTNLQTTAPMLTFDNPSAGSHTWTIWGQGNTDTAGFALKWQMFAIEL